MPLAATIEIPNDVNGNSGTSAPISLHSDWISIVGAGGVATADNGGSAAVSTSAPSTNTANRWFKAPRGTYIQTRLKYQGTPTTDLVGVLWGRKGDSGAPQRMYNKASTPATAVTLTTTVASDITDGTNFWTEVNPLTHTWDKGGCDQFLWTTTTAFNCSGTAETGAILEFKAF